MKSTSPAKGKGPMSQQNKSPKMTNSPIKKAKDAIKTVSPKNGNTPKGGQQKNKNKGAMKLAKAMTNGKKPEKPVTTDDSNTDTSEAPAKKQKVGMFSGTTSLESVSTAQKQKGKKGKKAAKASEGNKDKVSKKDKVSMINTIKKLMHEKDLKKLQTMLPALNNNIAKMEKVNSKTFSSKRKLRQLKQFKKRIESGHLEPTVQQRKIKNMPKVPKGMPLNSAESDEDDSEETVAEKLARAVAEDDEDSDDAEASDDADVPAAKNAKQAGKSATATQPKKKDRFVLFVGNLGYETTEDEIKEHFKKAGEVISVRLGKDKETDRSKGFCHLELANEEAYQRALSMHQTSLSGRRINVMYSQGSQNKGKSPNGGIENKKNSVKVKNMKLTGMRKQGLLAGSTKESQTRGARRKAAAAYKAAN